MNTTHLTNGTHTQIIEQSLLPFLSQTLHMFQNILTPIIQRLHPIINHLTQTLPNIAFSDTPLHSLRLHTTASLNYLTYTLLSQHDHIMAHATSIATSTPPHTTLPDLPHTLNTNTQHFTSRLLTGLHTILHTSVNEIYPSDARRAKARTGKHKASTRGACCNGHCQARLPYNAPICTQSGQPMHAYCAQPGVSPPICTQCYAIPPDLTDI